MWDVVDNRINCVWFIEQYLGNVRADGKDFCALFYWVGNVCEENGIKVFYDNGEKEWYRNRYEERKDDVRKRFELDSERVKSLMCSVLGKLFKKKDFKV